MALTVAVILAGGTGARMGLDLPKQLLPVAGKTSLEHTVEAFERAPGVDQIIVMMEREHMRQTRELLGGRYSKLTGIFPGGSTRNESSRLALECIHDDESKVLFHDAVRPLIDGALIGACIDALDEYSAVDVALPAVDTIIETTPANTIAAIPPREKLRHGQTPQGFRRGTIAAAYERAQRDPHFTATDDCSVVFSYLPQTPIAVVKGSEENIKLTRPVDLHMADKLFQLRHSRPALLADPGAALAQASVVIFGGSSGIGHELGAQLADAGATVHSFSRRENGTDVCRREDIHDALREAFARSGRIDHVVLSAGILTLAPLIDLDDEQLLALVNTHVMAAYRVAQESHPYLARSRGSLLFYTSSSYTRGRALYGVYSSTKAVLVNLTQALAEEWRGESIRVNCVSPARTATPMREQAFGPEDQQSLLDSAEVARASLHVLASQSTGLIYDIRREFTGVGVHIE